MTTRRGTTNRNARGSSYDRAARRAFLLAEFGDGETAPCYRCGVVLDDSTVTVDRIIPGCDGGRYTRDNIRPACGACNSETGGKLARREIVTVELPETCRLDTCVHSPIPGTDSCLWHNKMVSA